MQLVQTGDRVLVIDQSSESYGFSGTVQSLISPQLYKVKLDKELHFRRFRLTQLKVTQAAGSPGENIDPFAGNDTRAMNLGDGFGTGSVRNLLMSADPIALTGTTDETVLVSEILPADLLVENSLLRIYTSWSMPGNTNTKTKKVTLGSTILQNVGTNTGSVLTYARWLEVMARERTHLIAMPPAIVGAGLGQQAAAMIVSAEDLTAPLTLQIIGKLSNTGDTLTLQSYAVILHTP